MYDMDCQNDINHGIMHLQPRFMGHAAYSN